MALKLSDLKEDEYTIGGKPGASGDLAQSAINFAGGFVDDFASVGRNVQSLLPRSLSTIPGDNRQGNEVPTAERLAQMGAQDGTFATGAGRFASMATQFLAPSGAITKGQQVLQGAARLAPKGVQTAAKIGARVLPEAVGTGAVSFLRSGDTEQAQKDATIAGAFSLGLGTLGSLARSTYWPLLDDTVNKALGTQGKKSGGVALQQTAQKAAGLQVIKDLSDQLDVTLDDGTKAKFDPNNATYSTTLQAWNEARKKIYNDYSSLAKKAGETAQVGLSEVREELGKALDAPVLSVEKNAITQLIKDFDAAFPNPDAVDLQTAERFVKSLNDNTAQGFFQGTADAASSKVYAGTSRFIREKMDDVISEATGEGYQALRSQYAALKSVENDLVRRFQQNARQIGGGLPEYMGAFGGADIIASALTMNLAGLAKGTTLGLFAALKRKLADPERFLKRAFQLIDNEAPSDLSLRLWGGTRPLSQGEQQAAQEVVESASKPGLGLSTQAVKPSGQEMDAMEQFIDFERGVNLTDDFDPASLREEAEAIAKKLGFTEVGPALADKFADFLDTLRATSRN